MKRLLNVGLLLTAIMLIVAACGGGGGGKSKIAIGPAGSATNNVSKIILEAYGIGDDDYQTYEEGFGDAADLLQDNNIDVSFGVLGLPAGNIESLEASTGDVVMLGISDEAIENIESTSDYKRYTIPAGSYDFLEEDVETVAAFAVMVANTDTVDDELAYELARIMVEHADEVTHEQGKMLTLENALDGAEGLPIHPGAKKYYEEQGLTVDNPVADVSATEGDRKSEFLLGTGSQGGTYYPLGGEIANVWNNHLDVGFTNQETDASIENLASIGEGTMDLGMTVHVPAVAAAEGEDEFDGSPVENFAFIGHVYPEVIQIITREATDIESLDDLVE
ncbi:MAG TPA: TAXI family TRAP transporter solute-binding subunit [Pseudogracilibacillus sp.]|nr:TAXI family TRAP transporter solute-binding subunit [Pseudogracilibacillus sp.]